MDPANDDEDKIKRKLRLKNLFRIGFAVYFFLVAALIAYIVPKLTHGYNAELVWSQLFLILTMYIVEMMIDIYLITMMLKLQNIFRKFGLITGYNAEILISLVFPFTLATYTRD